MYRAVPMQPGRFAVLNRHPWYQWQSCLPNGLVYNMSEKLPATDCSIIFFFFFGAVDGLF